MSVTWDFKDDYIALYTDKRYNINIVFYK